MNNYDFSICLNSFIEYAKELSAQPYSYVIYGAGVAGRLLAHYLGDQVKGFVDRDPAWVDQSIESRPVYSPEKLPSLTFDRLIISVLGREHRIQEDLLAAQLARRETLTWFRQKARAKSFHLDLEETLASLEPTAAQRMLIQVGASWGNLARRFADNGWRVHAFDANPKYAEHFKTMAHVRGLSLYNQAISLNNEDSVTFYVSEKAPGMCSLAKFVTDHTPVTVPAVTLNNFYRREGISAIDYFMIDAETMDLAILKTHDWQIPIRAIMIECTKRNVDEIVDYVLSQNPTYDYTVMAWEKPTGALNEMGVYQGRLTVPEFKTRSDLTFGDMLFWDRRYIAKPYLLPE